MGTQQKTAAKVLRKALQLMNNSGAHWTKHYFEDKNPDTGETRYCSVGAIDKIINSSRLGDGEVILDVALDALAFGLPRSSLSNETRVTQWNDRPQRTWDDVVQRFNNAIERLEKE